jgi:uncharacterized protein (TIGR00369 family)
MATILELAQKLQRCHAPSPPIGQFLGFVLLAIEPGRAIFEMEADERHHNPMGTLHGGVFCDLADAAMGYTYAATLPKGETFTTVELKINFFRPVRRGKLIAEARVLRAGANPGFVECDVKDSEGRLVARARSIPDGALAAIGRDFGYVTFAAGSLWLVLGRRPAWCRAGGDSSRIGRAVEPTP